MDYMAREMIRGQVAVPASDVYALGRALYECLTGHQPYAGRQGMRILWAHLQEAPPAVRDTVPSLPEALDEVVGRSLPKEPAERYPTAGSSGRAPRRRPALRLASRRTRRPAPTSRRSW